MVLREPEVDAIIKDLAPTNDGIIVWEMFTQPINQYKDDASTKYVVSAACKAFNLGSDYNCDANIPVKPSDEELALY